MNDRIYNVIWIDDDGTLFTEDKLEDYLTDYNCRILNESEDSHNLGGDTKGLMASLKKYGHMVDAIILDLNFDYDGKQDVDKQTIEGFKSSMMALISNREYKNIPIFVLSAEPQFIQRKEIPEDFRNKIVTGKAFDKYTQEESLFRLLRETVDKMDAPEFIIRNRYHKELDVLHGLHYKYKGNDGQEVVLNSEKSMTEWLLADYNGDLQDTIDYFNQLREITEGLWFEFQKRGIVPDFLSVAEFKKIFNLPIGEYQKKTVWTDNRYEVWRFYKVNRNYSHPTLEHIIEFYQSFGNDGSHAGMQAKFEVKGYLSSNGNRPYLFKSLLFLALEIIAWAGELLSQNDKTENFVEVDSYGKTLYNGDIIKNGNIWFYGDTLLKPYNVLYIGDEHQPIRIGAVTEYDDDVNCMQHKFFYPIPGLVGDVKIDRKNRPYVFGCLVKNKRNIVAGNIVKIVNVRTINHKYNDGFCRETEVEILLKSKKTIIEKDAEGNWYAGKVLIKPSSKKSTDTPPEGECLLGAIGINNNNGTKEKYPLIARGLLIENINVAVFPGYILDVRLREGVLTASNCLVEGEKIKEGDTVVVKDVVSNGDSTTNKMYKAKLIVELYKEEGDGDKEGKETTE